MVYINLVDKVEGVLLCSGRYVVIKSTYVAEHLGCFQSVTKNKRLGSKGKHFSKPLNFYC